MYLLSSVKIYLHSSTSFQVLPSEYDDYETTPCFVHLAYYMERPLEVGDDDDYDLTCSRIIKNVCPRIYLLCNNISLLMY